MASARLANQVTWISGGASGIGEATARLFAGEGARVTITDVNLERAQEVAAQINASGEERAVAIECDVSRRDDVERSVQETVERFGALHILVNNAGIVGFTPLDSCSEEEWDRIIAVNVKSTYLSFRAAYPHLRKHDQSYIVNVASISSFVGQAHTPVYTVSKHALLGLTRTIALDYAAHGVRCNCVCPGITDTRGLRGHLEQHPDTDEKLAERLRRVPTGKILTPGQIARAILYFSCEDSAGVTGTSLIVDGGYLAAAEWESGKESRAARVSARRPAGSARAERRSRREGGASRSPNGGR